MMRLKPSPNEETVVKMSSTARTGEIRSLRRHQTDEHQKCPCWTWGTSTQSKGPPPKPFPPMYWRDMEDGGRIVRPGCDFRHFDAAKWVEQHPYDLPLAEQLIAVFPEDLLVGELPHLRHWPDTPARAQDEGLD